MTANYGKTLFTVFIYQRLPDFKCLLVAGRVEFFVCSLPDLPVYLYSIVCLKDKLEQLGGWSDQTDRKCVWGRAAQCALRINLLLCTLRKERKRKKCLTSKRYWGVYKSIAKHCQTFKTSQELRMLSSVTIYCHALRFSIVRNVNNFTTSLVLPFEGIFSLSLSLSLC